eukprot:TRINITY_DN473_c0_g1_i1.p1 TRINITY_DN473_c0_g1~~TRINITY_DN473_c0_g1_i1.p1  ORF type:complete len:209 (-),score=41.19 TRINITY_DN473_c0_g1_i1:33-659(-)
MAKDTCARCSLMTTNIVGMAIGIVVLVLGIITIFSWDEYPEIVTEFQRFGRPVSIAVICLGSFIVALTLLGCLGVKYKKRALIIIYLIFFALLVLLTWGVGIGSFVTVTALKNDLGPAWNTLPRNVTAGIEKEYNCCGWDKATDDPDCAVVSTTPCGPIVIDLVSKPFFIVGGVLIVLGIIYTLVFIFTALYARRMKKRDTDGYAEVF